MSDHNEGFFSAKIMDTTKLTRVIWHFFLRSFFGHFLTSGGFIPANIMFRQIKIISKIFANEIWHFFLRSFFGHFLTSGRFIPANIMFWPVKIDLERDMISIEKISNFFLLHTCGTTYDQQSEIVDFLLNFDVPGNFCDVPDVCK